MWVELLLSATLTSTFPSPAQETLAPPATPEQIAQARAYADRLIQEGDAGAFFSNKTDSAVPHVVHWPSGLSCLFAQGGGERVVVFPTGASNIPSGDDVGCMIFDEADGVEKTLYATRWRPLPAESVLLGQTVDAITQRWPSAQPFTGPMMIATLENPRDPARAAFSIALDSGEFLTIAMVSNRGEWSYKLRVTGPLDDSESVSLSAAITMAYVLIDLRPE